MFALLAGLALAGCAQEAPAPIRAVPSPDSKRVLVVYNSASAQSTEIGRYYIARRAIPQTNVVRVNCVSAEDIDFRDFERDVLTPIQSNLKGNRNAIDFIVLVKGIPIRLKVEQQYSVDAWIAAGSLQIVPIKDLTEENLRKSLNPYFNAREPFSSKKFGFYLVTRLDGYTTSDCKDLVDRSILAKPETGPFLFDEADNRKDPAYLPTQAGLAKAASTLKSKGLDVRLDSSASFVVPDDRLAGYASWGSNDAAFTLGAYRLIRFKPGALSETFVSTSGRTFTRRDDGQSLIGDLIANGVTGVKGYVSEPYTFALAKPEILFDRYTSGFNLAESFYAASMFLKWKDVVVGDPLCSPYARKPNQTGAGR